MAMSCPLALDPHRIAQPSICPTGFLINLQNGEPHDHSVFLALFTRIELDGLYRTYPLMHGLMLSLDARGRSPQPFG
jgi:hypothetical protein